MSFPTPAADMSATDTDGTQPPPPTKRARKSTAQTKDPANASRIRDNQRRSRARRKEYVEELQRQVQEYEKQGVQASLDIQKAARDVSIENSRLRTLLSHRGVSAPEVDAYLRSFDGIAHPDGPLPDHHLVKREHSLPLPLPPTQQHTVSHRTTSLDPLSVLADASTQVSSSTAASAAPHFHEQRTVKACRTPQQQAPPPPTQQHHASAYPPAASPLQMSCNAAARIIADMQGHSDARHARASLGCSPYEQDCVVNNVALFRILEQ
ncbi:hypothetical protein B0T11DRAFT_66742 [Plectosphaerella cucumerina]|uniref:BZIP domain-containing protein n=1 Tax=Plectosphaerella cucumerina TaxID=40658 RepID=A0A8K0X6U6_9PEZI|nr:hypothetical protein B0T11DRAFT_66742 [Plectosphaerella cucumerina]